LLPHALLGTAFHATVEAANKGALANLDPEAQLAEARDSFDASAQRVHARAHPLLRTKFPVVEKVPYYNLFRERAALEAQHCATRLVPVDSRPVTAAHSDTHPVAERRLVSADGKVAGRADLIDRVAEEVVDYKTGPRPTDGVDDVSDAEIRQLTLYTHLAHDNGIPIARGVIARANGIRSTIAISREQAAREGQRARDILNDYNSRAGEPFEAAAQPSAQACRFCPCIPFCEAFWRSARPEWADDCGVHAEGIIHDIETTSIQGVGLTTVRIDLTRGTVASGHVHIEQMPNSWIEADGTGPLRAGETVRIVYGRVASESPSRVLRVDRVATSIWTVGSPVSSG